MIMADDFDQKLEQVKDFLNNEDMAENIKALMSMLSSNNNSTKAAKEKQHETITRDIPKTTVPMQEKSPAYQKNQSLPIEMDTMIKIKKVYDKINDPNDPGVNLLMALKPYLNEKRKERLDSAVKMMSLSKLPAVIQEIETEMNNE